MQTKKAQISTWGLIMVVLGSTIGSGIFSTPSTIASEVSSEGWIYAVWSIGGLITLSGAIIYARLAKEFHGAGGVYLYLKEAYGNAVAFLYGWSILTVITSGAVAAITIVAVDYVKVFYSLTDNQSLVLGASIILFHCLVHSRGVRIGELFVNTLSGAKFLGLLAVIVSGLFFLPAADISALATPDFSPSAGALSVALVAVLWSFGGFQHASFLSGETKSSETSVPKAMIIGTLLVTSIYMLINFALIRVLGVDTLMGSEKPVADVLAVGSEIAGKLVAILVIISTFGAGFVFTMSAPRIYEQMGTDGVFFSFLAKRHKRFNTPANAIMTQSLWSIVLLGFWGTFKALITYSTFLDWVFLGMAGFSILLLMRKSKFHLGYTIAAILFSVAVLGFLVAVLIEGPEQAYYGLGLLIVGFITYLFFKGK